MKDNKWSYKPLSALCGINLGSTPSRSKSEYWGKGYSWVSISDLKEKYISKTKEEITDVALSESNCKIVKKGTLLMSFKLSIGKLAFADKDLYTNEAIVALPIKDESELNKEYLYYVLKSIPLVGGNQAAMGQTLNKQSLSVLQIPLPPTLDDQKRIAKVLSQCEALIQKRKESIYLLDELLRSTFLEMFGDPILNPKEFPINKLSDFYINPKEGTKCGPFGSALKNSEYTSSGIPVWNMDNISKNGNFLDSIRLWINEDKYDQLLGFSAQNGDIIISRAGTVGKMCVLKSDYPKSIISTNLIRLRLNQENLLPLYFVSLMNYCKGRIGRLKKGADGGFTHMNTGVLDTLSFPYPSPILQNKFAQLVEKTEETKKPFQESLKEFENLYGSISQRAFNGELDLSKVDISDMEDSKKKEFEDVKDNTMEQNLAFLEQKSELLEIIDESKDDSSYLSINCRSYIENSKALRTKIYLLSKKDEITVDDFRIELIEINSIGEQLKHEIKEFTPWQIDQHKSVERYIPFLPENILEEFQNINLFSRNQFDYSSMTLDDYYGIPEDIIKRYGSIENQTMDLEFFFKRHFSNQFFTIEDVVGLYDRLASYGEGNYKYEEIKEFIFKSLETDDALLAQTFEEFKIQDEETGDSKTIKKIMLKVIS